MTKPRMYAKTVTWNPFRGCRFDCTYCVPSFQALAKWQQCPQCKSYEPHEHPERLEKLPAGGDILFACSSGDVSFCDPAYFRRILDAVRDDPRDVYLQSKSPWYFDQFLAELPENVVIVTTLETNRDDGYEHISKAPPPSVRWRDFELLNWPRKVITVEPMMDFDVFAFWNMIVGLGECVWVGYNSRPHAAPLPEPSRGAVIGLIGRLVDSGIDVRGKDLRGLEIPEYKGAK